MNKMNELIDEEYKQKSIELLKNAMDKEILFLQTYHEYLLNSMERSKTKEELQQIFKIWKYNRS